MDAVETGSQLLLERCDADIKEDKKEIYTIDEFLYNIGQIGRFQIIVLVLLACMMTVPGYQALFMVFAAPAPSWKCSGINKNECNSSTVFSLGVDGFESRCLMNRSAWTYASKTSFSIVTEFELVCSREALLHLANSALFIGTLITGFPMAYISDRYGRKPVLSFSFITLCIFSCLTYVSPNIWVVILLRTLSGGSFIGIMMTVVVISLELVGPKYRACAGLIFWNAWGVGLCLLSLQSWLIPEWKILAMVTSAPYLVLGLGFLFIPESVRWYRSQNRIEEAEAILRKVAKINSRKYPNNKYLSPVDDTSGTKASYKHLFLSMSEALKTVILCFMWLTNELNYYGIAMASGDFGGNMHRDFVLLTICEIPTCLIGIWFIDKVGRKKATITGYVATSSSLICFGFLQQFNVQILPLRATLGIIAKIFNIISWSATEVWSGELYPTVVRSQAIGLFFILSQLGGAVSPWIAIWLKNYSISLPFFIFGGFPIVAGCLAMHLKETRGKSIEDVVKGIPEVVNVECLTTVQLM